MIEVRFTFKSKVYITAETIEKARETFEGMELLSADAIANYGKFIEVCDEEIVASEEEEDDDVCPYCGDDYIVDSRDGLRRCMGCGNEF